MMKIHAASRLKTFISSWEPVILFDRVEALGAEKDLIER